MRRIPCSGPVFLLLITVAAPALAAWPNAPTTNLPVSTAAGGQYLPEAVSDGAGGILVAWYDDRSGSNFDIYAQHVLATGVVDPAWPANGRAVCTAVSDQYSPVIVSDGAGGAIISWGDLRSGVSGDIYAQHLLASGVVDPNWPVDGRALCTAAGNQGEPVVVADGAGGAIVAWDDARSGLADVYAQHVLALGVVDAAWPVNGRALCTAADAQIGQVIGSDGAGGAIVAWQDYRFGPSPDIYAQRVLAAGTVDPAWPANGRVVCSAVNAQASPQLAADGMGGAVIGWSDSRSPGYRVYAQRVLVSGVTDPMWPVDGVAISPVFSATTFPVIVPDGAGGAILAWEDYRSAAQYDIYAHHVLATGAVDPAWPVNGRALCLASLHQYTPKIAADGAGGAFVMWYDTRGGFNADLYAQHVSVAGVVDPTWPTDGRAVSTATSDQQDQTCVSDGNGGVIFAWDDNRNATRDIYAGRVARYGYLGSPEPEIVSVRDVPNDQGGHAKVSWNASYLEADPYLLVSSYKVFRSVPPNLASVMLRGGARAMSADESAQGFDRPGDLLVTRTALTTYWEYLTTVNADFISNYSFVAPTAQDSTSSGAPTTAFMIQARGGPGYHWESPPLSGYSVDNLGPAAPVPFTGQYLAGTTHLHWNPNTEADLAGYRLYRGTSPGFLPAPDNLVSAPTDTGYADVAGAPYVYKLVAVDVHGNVSPVATLVPSGTTAVGDRSPAMELALAVSPNPAMAVATLRFTLPQAGRVRLAVYDAAGRLVREIAGGMRTPGDQAEHWDLRDAGGRTVGAGLYFARLEFTGRTRVTRIAVTR